MSLLSKTIRRINNAQNENLFRPFDEEFYKTFEGKYFHGVPIYYYLKDMSLGQCYDASELLGLTLGKDAIICRGDLLAMTENWGKDKTGHGWVEKNGLVYDTTLQMICDIKTYYKILKVKNVTKFTYDQYFSDNANLSNYTIRSKEWYEKNDTTDNAIIILVREIAQMKAKKATTKKEKEFYLKLLTDLPSIEKHSQCQDIKL